MAGEIPGAVIVPLHSWVNLHPAALADEKCFPALRPFSSPGLTRSKGLAAALAATNARWGNPVEGELQSWLAGAEVIVTGQQPGLFGGPLLTLIKTCAVAAEVKRRKAAGRDAVGFLWLATADDDLPEMGWAKVALGEEVLATREAGWRAGEELGGTALLGTACADLLTRLDSHQLSPFASDAVALARECFAPGQPLGEGTARFLVRLLAGSGIIIIDALEPTLARASAAVVGQVLHDLPRCWEAIADGGEVFTRQGWSIPLRISSHKLPVFRRAGNRRETIATRAGACPGAVLAEQAEHPERFLPNAWLRPLVQDAALGSSLSFLGGAELAYHRQTGLVRQIAGVGYPEWRLRPHVTVISAAERRLCRQLRLSPERLLRSTPPTTTMAGKRSRQRLDRLRRQLDHNLATLDATAAVEFPNLKGDLEATAKKLSGTFEWLEERFSAAAIRASETELGRWRRLRAILRPEGHPQERTLSVLAPLLRLGLAWPQQLINAIDPDHPGMHLLFWEEGGLW